MEFDYGSMRTYSTNVIAESMYAQCDEEGKQYLWFGSMLDHNTDGPTVSVGCTWDKFETQNHERLARMCPMEGWDNNMVEDIRHQGIPYHSG